jgi:hypothetical protein
MDRTLVAFLNLGRGVVFFSPKLNPSNSLEVPFLIPKLNQQLVRTRAYKQDWPSRTSLHQRYRDPLASIPTKTGRELQQLWILDLQRAYQRIKFRKASQILEAGVF